MFIAHIPAGYLAASLFARKQKNRRSVLAVGIVCSVLPDMDLLWFYLVDSRQVAHHNYIFHWPLYWLSLALAGWIASWVLGHKGMRAYILVALICLLLHTLLDSFAAEIYWFRPFSDIHLNVIEVPARYGWWVWNFVFHWTFTVELAFCFVAAIVYFRRKNDTGSA
ncbi:MAG: metal-dependent hydrolase [Paracoccaceae bacterium]